MKAKFYNTLTREKEIFRPFKDKKVNLFICGPTVYDWSHIGHARTYIAYDALARYLRRLGYKVFALVNITDIDDKIIKRANEEGKTFLEVSQFFTKAFLDDMKALRIVGVNKYAPASKYIPEIIAQVERLIRRSFAYVGKDGSVYFRVRKFKQYGKLSRQKIDEVKPSEPGEFKEDILDFTLWKASKPGEPKWKSPWGWGRPGWHIEDTAISEKFFGVQYDIHGGGRDLIFPHHEAEIAQQEAASGKQPFVKYWLHTGMLQIKGEKMAKSLKNFITIRDFLSSRAPETLRLAVFQHHYRSPLNYTGRLLEQTEAAKERLAEFTVNLKQLRPAGVDKMGTERAIAKARKAFYDALADDFNTPKALAEIFTLISRLNPLLSKGNIGAKAKQETLKFLGEVDAIFGIIGKTTSRQAPEEIKRLVRKRESLRKEKKWQEADRVRKQVEKLGWRVEDTAAGPRLKKAN